MEVKLDVHGWVSEQSCMQWTGQPMRDKTGVATRRYVRDARGIVVAIHFLGLDRTPHANRDGVTTLRFELDTMGRERVRRYHDADDKPVRANDGCYSWQYEYDARGLEVRRTCLDSAGQPQRAANGIASETYRYDARGCITNVRYAERDGTAATDRRDVHGLDIVPGPSCQQISRTCVNIVDEPTACDIAAPARSVHSFDKRGRLVSRKHYNADGSPGLDAGYEVFELRWQYSEVGNPIAESCHGRDGKPNACAHNDYHAVRRTYDNAGREIEIRYVDTRGVSATRLGTAVVRTKFDNYDHAFESNVIDAHGDLVDVDGMSTRRELYDTAHRRFALLLFDSAGEPAHYAACYVGVTCPDEPWHAVRLVRGIDGRVASNQFFDAAGELMTTHDCSKVACFQ